MNLSTSLLHRLLSIISWWFCCCRFVVYSYSHCLLGVMFGPCFVMQYLVTFLVLQASPWGSESWSLCNAYVYAVVSCYCSVPFPCGALGWSVVWSYLLAFIRVF